MTNKQTQPKLLSIVAAKQEAPALTLRAATLVSLLFCQLKCWVVGGLVMMDSIQNVYLEKDTIARSITKYDLILTAIHVIKKRSLDLQLWVMVSGGWY